MAEPAAISTAKKALRSLVRRRLAGVSTEALAAQSSAVADRLARFPRFATSRCVAVFLSMPALEIDTRAVIDRARVSKTCILVPKVVGPSSADMIFVHIQPHERMSDFPVDRWHIPDPPLTYCSESTAACGPRFSLDPHGESSEPLYKGAILPPVDIVLVPGLAFSPSGARLGHGKGFYGAE